MINFNFNKQQKQHCQIQWKNNIFFSSSFFLRWEYCWILNQSKKYMAQSFIKKIANETHLKVLYYRNCNETGWKRDISMQKKNVCEKRWKVFAVVYFVGNFRFSFVSHLFPIFITKYFLLVMVTVKMFHWCFVHYAPRRQANWFSLFCFHMHIKLIQTAIIRIIMFNCTEYQCWKRFISKFVFEYVVCTLRFIFFYFGFVLLSFFPLCAVHFTNER